MLRTLGVCWLLLAVVILPVAGVLTAQSRAAGTACAEGRCCCAPEPAEAATETASGSPEAAGGCCAPDDGNAVAAQLVPACACGGHGGAQHVAPDALSLALPSERVGHLSETATGRWAPDAATRPSSRVIAPEPPPPRRAG
jgi:hypothetical protein